jgi:hypothetical protein
MIDDTSPPGSWKQALEYKKLAQNMDNDELAVVMEKCIQWKQSTAKLCALCADHITLSDLRAAGLAIDLSIEE